ncbi:MAG: hypothetical protein KOO62_09720 [candidate division Zixibacteria bacterium]|nr:hypothetical protein [candidate division Zixibacteria bacterium]
MKRTLLILVLLLPSLVWADPVVPGDSTTLPATDSLIEDGSMIVSIGRMTIENMTLSDTLFVTLDATGAPLAGFDFKIGIDNPMVDIVEILPGEIYDSCRWEYFSARQIIIANREGYPPLLWQTVALADMASGADQPVCFGFNREASLLKLVLSNEHVLDQPDTAVQIFFFWEDCTDNTISGRTGNKLLISRQVFDYVGTKPEAGSRLFPTRTGAPEHCINPSKVNRPRRMIDFHNGGVEFRLRIDPEPVDTSKGE